MVLCENEQRHRMSYEAQELTATIADVRRGHWIGGLLGLSCVAGAVYTSFIGAHWSVSVALVGLPITALAGKFFTRHNP